jgi:hypothetical protein
LYNEYILIKMKIGDKYMNVHVCVYLHIYIYIYINKYVCLLLRTDHVTPHRQLGWTATHSTLCLWIN